MSRDCLYDAQGKLRCKNNDNKGQIIEHFAFGRRYTVPTVNTTSFQQSINNDPAVAAAREQAQADYIKQREAVRAQQAEEDRKKREAAARQAEIEARKIPTNNFQPDPSGNFIDISQIKTNPIDVNNGTSQPPKVLMTDDQNISTKFTNEICAQNCLTDKNCEAFFYQEWPGNLRKCGYANKEAVSQGNRVFQHGITGGVIMLRKPDIPQ